MQFPTVKNEMYQYSVASILHMTYFSLNWKIFNTEMKLSKRKVFQNQNKQLFKYVYVVSTLESIRRRRHWQLQPTTSTNGGLIPVVKLYSIISKLLLRLSLSCVEKFLRRASEDSKTWEITLRQIVSQMWQLTSTIFCSIIKPNVLLWTLLISNYCCFGMAISSTLLHQKFTLFQIHSKLLNTDLGTVDQIVVIEEEQGQKTTIGSTVPKSVFSILE